MGLVALTMPRHVFSRHLHQRTQASFISLVPYIRFLSDAGGIAASRRRRVRGEERQAIKCPRAPNCACASAPRLRPGVRGYHHTTRHRSTWRATPPRGRTVIPARRQDGTLATPEGGLAFPPCPEAPRPVAPGRAVAARRDP